MTTFVSRSMRRARSGFVVGRFYAGVLAALMVLALDGCTVTVPGSQRSVSTSTSSGISVRANVIHGPNNATLVLLPVTIESQGPYTFALDTGASTSLIARSLAQRLGLPRTGSSQPISGVGGTTQEVPVDVRNWHIGPIRLPNMSIGASALPTGSGGPRLEGLMGSDIWDQFGRMTIDYASGTVTVYKQVAKIRPAPVDGDQPRRRSVA